MVHNIPHGFVPSPIQIGTPTAFFISLNPPTAGKHLYRSFIGIMSIWKQMDRQQKGEIHTKLIGANILSVISNATRSMLLAVGLSKGKAHPVRAQSIPAASKHLSAPQHYQDCKSSPSPACGIAGEGHKGWYSGWAGGGRYSRMLFSRLSNCSSKNLICSSRSFCSMSKEVLS